MMVEVRLVVGSTSLPSDCSRSATAGITAIAASVATQISKKAEGQCKHPSHATVHSQSFDETIPLVKLLAYLSKPDSRFNRKNQDVQHAFKNSLRQKLPKFAISLTFQKEKSSQPFNSTDKGCHEDSTLNLSPVPIWAIAPAAKLAARGAAQLVESGRDFASFMAGRSETTGKFEGDAGQSDNTFSGFDRLLEPLREFLRAQGYESNDRLDLVSSGDGTIRVDADPGLKETVEAWITQNPEWRREWQSETTHQLTQFDSSHNRFLASNTHQTSGYQTSPRIHRQKVLF
jgi:hypothetical protein